MGYVMPTTRPRVRRTVGSLGGRRPRTEQRRYGVILISAHPDGDPTLAVLKGSTAAAHEINARVEVLTIGDLGDRDSIIERAVRFGRHLHGVMLWGHVRTWVLEGLRRAEVPFIVLGNSFVVPSEVAPEILHIINNDQMEMGRFATKLLFGRGHQRVGFICETKPPRMHNDTWHLGYHAAHWDAGLPVDPSLTFVGEHLETGAEPAAEAMAALASPPRAYVITDTALATRFMTEMKRRGVELKREDVVIGAEVTQIGRYDLAGHPLILGSLDGLAKIGLQALNDAQDGKPLIPGILNVPFTTANL
jgi:DNA-binding LacI/PurR family transcriptional regulator